MFYILILILLKIILGQELKPSYYNLVKLREAFLLLKVTELKSNPFYRVMVDSKETPFLNLQEFAKNYLDIYDIYCNNRRLYCYLKINELDQEFWLDIKNREMGNSKAKTQIIPKNSVYIDNNTVWIRYDVLSKWLPLSSSWNLSLYFLSIIPKFKLKAQREIEREKERLIAIQKGLELKKIEKVKALTPQDKFRSSFRYTVKLEKAPNSNLGSSLSLENSTDIFEGNFVAGAQVKFSDTVYTNTPYYSYTQRYKKYYDFLQVGNTVFQDINLLIPNFYVDNGIRLDSKERLYNSGTIDIRGYTDIGTEVELYRDGVYIATAKVSSDGRYIFKNILVNKFSSLYLKLYRTDGSYETKRVYVADDDGTILKKDELEYRFISGHSEYGYFAYATTRYGLYDNFSVGFHPMYLPDSKALSFMLDLGIKPFYGLSLTAQNILSFKASSLFFDSGIRINFSYLYPSLWQFEYRHYSLDSPTIFNTQRTFGNYYLLRHSFSFARLNFINEFEYNTELSRLYNYIIFNLSSKCKLYSKFTQNWEKNTFDNTISLGTHYALSHLSRISLSRTWSESLGFTNLEYTLYGFYDIPWDISSSLSFVDGGEYSFYGELSYRYNYNFKFGISWSKQYLGFSISYTDIIAPKPKVNNWMNYGAGTLYGRVFSPNKEPILGAEIVVAGRRVKTNKNGYFVLGGIEPYKKLKVYIAPNSLDISLAPEKDFEVVYFRPSTVIEYNPVIVRNVGIDGFIKTNTRLENSAKIAIYKININNKETYLKEVAVEEDGFFIIEKLKPGRYKLSLTNSKLKIKDKIIDIQSNTDWISGIVWY